MSRSPQDSLSRASHTRLSNQYLASYTVSSRIPAYTKPYHCTVLLARIAYTPRLVAGSHQPGQAPRILYLAPYPIPDSRLKPPTIDALPPLRLQIQGTYPDSTSPQCAPSPLERSCSEVIELKLV